MDLYVILVHIVVRNRVNRQLRTEKAFSDCRVYFSITKIQNAYSSSRGASRNGSNDDDATVVFAQKNASFCGSSETDPIRMYSQPISSSIHQAHPPKLAESGVDIQLWVVEAQNALPRAAQAGGAAAAYVEGKGGVVGRNRGCVVVLCVMDDTIPELRGTSIAKLADSFKQVNLMSWHVRRALAAHCSAWLTTTFPK